MTLKSSPVMAQDQPLMDSLYRQPNDVGGYQYWSDEIGGGVLVWDTCLVDDRTLRETLRIEEQHGFEQPFKAIPYDKLLCNGQYLCYDPRRPGYIVGMWTDRWITLNREMVLDACGLRVAIRFSGLSSFQTWLEIQDSDNTHGLLSSTSA
jgi:hypothetical protein